MNKRWDAARKVRLARLKRKLEYRRRLLRRQRTDGPSRVLCWLRARPTLCEEMGEDEYAVFKDDVAAMFSEAGERCNELVRFNSMVGKYPEQWFGFDVGSVPVVSAVEPVVSRRPGAKEPEGRGRRGVAPRRKAPVGLVASVSVVDLTPILAYIPTVTLDIEVPEFPAEVTFDLGGLLSELEAGRAMWRPDYEEWVLGKKR